MAGETPDYRRLNAETITFPVTDLGELAARLGSIDRYDRRGDVVDLWDFESGLAGWTRGVGAGGGELDLSLIRARSGMFSARLVSGNAAGNTTAMLRGAPVPTSGLTGLEVAYHTGGGNNRLSLWMLYARQGTQQQFAVRYRRDQNDLQVLDDTNTWVTVATYPALSSTFQDWNGFKFVADLSALRYERLLFNELDVDLSAYAPYSPAGAAQSIMRVQVMIDTAAAATTACYVDDVILTQGEPPN